MARDNTTPDHTALQAEIFSSLRSIVSSPHNPARDASSLVREAWRRLQGAQVANTAGPADFYLAAAAAMREILLQRAQTRDKTRDEAPGANRLPPPALDSIAAVTDLYAAADPDQILTVDAAFRRLEDHDPAVADVALVRFFAGLTPAETAQALGIPERTAELRWAYARAWLARQILQPS